MGMRIEKKRELGEWRKDTRRLPFVRLWRCDYPCHDAIETGFLCLFYDRHEAELVVGGNAHPSLAADTHPINICGGEDDPT